jgi:hypothetical protein
MWKEPDTELLVREDGQTKSQINWAQKPLG